MTEQEYVRVSAHTPACRSLVDSIEKMPNNNLLFKEQEDVPYYNGFKTGSNGEPLDSYLHEHWDAYNRGWELYEMGWWDATENYIPD